jgi:alkaline phosphatase D
VPYPFWDLTSSGLTETWPYLAPNKYRVGEGYSVQNFGTIEIDWDVRDPVILLGTRDVNGKPLISQRLTLSELKA